MHDRRPHPEYALCQLSQASTLLGESSSSVGSTISVNRELSSSPFSTHGISKKCSGRSQESNIGSSSCSSSSSSSSSGGRSSSHSRVSQVRAKKRRSVSFRDDLELVEVREAIHLHDFTDEEYHMYWISHAEQSMILDMADMTTALWQMGAAEDLENHICYRGLEGKSPKAVDDYTERYLDLVQGVLWAQKNCLDADRTINYDQIAELYQECTRECQEVAWQRAQMDEYEACQYYMAEMHEVISGDENDSKSSSSSSSSSTSS